MITESEWKVAEIIWDEGAVSASSLSKECEKRYHWKTTTTYTFIKRLKDKGYICTDESNLLHMTIEKGEYLEDKAQSIIIDTYHGSLPMFINAFVKKQKLSPKEVEELQDIIDSLKGE